MSNKVSLCKLLKYSKFFKQIDAFYVPVIGHNFEYRVSSFSKYHITEHGKMQMIVSGFKLIDLKDVIGIRSEDYVELNNEQYKAFCLMDSE